MTDATSKGHVKVARKAFASDPWWLAKREFSKWEAWIDMIQLAQWAPRRLETTRYGTIQLERGEFVLSLRAMADRWGWSVRSVRTFTESREFSARLEAQRTTQAGIVYRIVNYDIYQSSQPKSDTPPDTPNDKPSTHLRHTSDTRTSSKAVKQVKPLGLAPLDALPRATMDALYDAWVRRLGAVNYGHLRKAIFPVFEAAPRVYTAAQLADAVEAFHEGRDADSPAFRGKWTVQKFAAELHTWVRLGGMEITDDYGTPTERGRAGVFARAG